MFKDSGVRNDKSLRGLQPGPSVPPEVARKRFDLFQKLKNQKKAARKGTDGHWDNFEVEWWDGAPKLVCVHCEEPFSASNPSFTNAHHIKNGACKALKQRAASLSQQQQSETSSAAPGPSATDQQAHSKRRRGVDGQTFLPVVPATLTAQVLEGFGLFFYKNNVPIHLIEKPELRKQQQQAPQQQAARQQEPQTRGTLPLVTPDGVPFIPETQID